jgi:hypothetical protein
MAIPHDGRPVPVTGRDGRHREENLSSGDFE